MHSDLDSSSQVLNLFHFFLSIEPADFGLFYFLHSKILPSSLISFESFHSSNSNSYLSPYTSHITDIVASLCCTFPSSPSNLRLERFHSHSSHRSCCAPLRCSSQSHSSLLTDTPSSAYISNTEECFRLSQDISYRNLAWLLRSSTQGQSQG